jgi:glycosyltransferase involved in cell wall biosynthesis
MNKEINQPLVSIVVNCFNGEKFLNQAINSVLKQTYINWEIIFWDNCSTDNSCNIIHSYAENIKYYKSEINTNLGEARKLALQKCKGKYLAFLDVDDYWHPEKLQKQVSLMCKDSSALSYTGSYLIDENNKILKTYKPKYFSGFHFPKLLENFDINLPSTIIDLDLLRSNNLFFDERIVGSEEYDLFMQIAAEFRITVLDEVLCYYRISKNSLTNQTLEFRASDKILTFEKLNIKYPNLKEKYKKKWDFAYNKIFYYKMQYYIFLNDKKNAVKEINKIKYTNYKYFTVWLVLKINIKLYKFVLKKYDLRGI